MGDVELKLRSRNVGHAWYDKQVIRWFRKTFTKIQYKNLRNIYIALTEIDSDFGSTSINGLAKTIKNYAGISHSISTRYIHFLKEAGFVKIEQQRVGAKFGPSTMSLMMWTNQSEYYQEHREYLESILNGEVNIRKSQLNTNVVNHKCGHNKNTKVSINKNTKVSNSLSKDKDNPKRVIRIKKKRKYKDIVYQTYNKLVELGGTNHKFESKAYNLTLDNINKLLSKRAYNPFHGLTFYKKEQREKQYTADDLIRVFEYHLKWCKNENKQPVKSIGMFIHLKPWNNNGEQYSPFLNTLFNMESHEFEHNDGEIKIIMRECEKLNTPFSKGQAIRLLTILGKKTKTHLVPTSLNHLYFGKPLYVLLEYIDSKVRKKRLPPQVIASETFIDNFIDYAVQKKTLIRGNGQGAY